MQVILIEEVPNLGHIGQQVSARDGYARNYLFPNKLAIPASVRNKAKLEHEKRIANFRLAKAKAEAEAVAQKVRGVPVSIARKVGEQDKLFGSVTARDIEEALAAKGIEIDRRKIDLKEPIKALGEHTVHVKLAGDIVADIKVSVVAEQ